MITMTEKDRRALLLLAVVAPLMLVYWWTTREPDQAATVVGPASANTIPAAEQRLERVRQMAATTPGKQQVLTQVSAELAAREKNLIKAETAAQAQAQLVQIIRNLAKAPTTNIDLRSTESGQVKAFGEHYGEVMVSVNFEAGIEQLLNFLSDLTAEKALISTTELRIGTANAKQKTMPVRLTISGLVRRELVPDKKAGAF